MKIKVVQYCVTQGQIPEQHRNAAAWQDWTAGLGSKQRISVPSPDAPCWAHRVQEQSPTLLHSSLIPASTPVFIPSISQGHQPTGGIYLIELCVCLRDSGLHPLHQSPPLWEPQAGRAASVIYQECGFVRYFWPQRMQILLVMSQ